MSARASTSSDDAHLLGRHVERRAHERRGLRDATAACASTIFEMPKSSTLTAAGRRRGVARKRFAGLQIAVDDPERVRLGERLAGLEQVVDGATRGGAPLRSSSSSARSRPRGTP